MQKAERAVFFDGLTSLSLGMPSERRFKELVYAFGKHVRAGATLPTTLEAEQLLGSEQFSGRGASFIADGRGMSARQRTTRPPVAMTTPGL